MSFSNLKRASSALSKITKAIEDANNKKFAADEREWQPTVDKAGNGSAVVRLLPPPEQDGDDALPWVRLFTHGFKGPNGQWLIENCPTTLGQDHKCPVCESNSVLWNTGEKHNQDIVRTRKRKLIYVTNVLVITDQDHPENEGKVKIFKFGKKIFDKISALMNPDADEGDPINPFDLWKGANLKIKIKNVDGYRNYDDSKFLTPSALLDGNDEKLEAIWRQEYSLKEFIDPKKFKTHEDIQKRLTQVLGSGITPPTKSATETNVTKSVTQKEEKTPIQELPPPTASHDMGNGQTPFDNTEDEDDLLKTFQDLTEDA